MSEITVTKTRFVEGMWEGRVTAPSGIAPKLEVMHRERALEGVEVAPLPEAGHHALKVPVPPSAIGDGIHTFIVRDATTGAELAHFSVLAGEALADTLRAEVDLLREELDLLKRAFRRHCVETA